MLKQKKLVKKQIVQKRAYDWWISLVFRCCVAWKLRLRNVSKILRETVPSSRIGWTAIEAGKGSRNNVVAHLKQNL